MTPLEQPSLYQLCSGMAASSAEVDLQRASCRNLKDKDVIDNMIERKLGFEQANAMCAEAVDHAFWVELRARCSAALVSFVVRCLAMVAVAVYAIEFVLHLSN